MKVTLILAVLFCGIFVVSIGLGVVQVFQEQAFLDRAELDTGTIVDSQVDSSGKYVVFCPKIEFTTKAGEPVTYEGADCQDHPYQVKIGQKVQVYYDPRNPDSMQTSHGSRLVQIADRTGFKFFFGCLFLGIALFMVVVAFAANRQVARRASTTSGSWNR